jgi:hypothetical protein
MAESPPIENTCINGIKGKIQFLWLRREKGQETSFKTKNSEIITLFAVTGILLLQMDENIN